MSSPAVANASSSRGVQAAEAASGGDASSAAPPSDVLPSPTMPMAEAHMDVMALLYALTASQRDAAGKDRKETTERKGEERKEAFEHQQEEIRKAREAQEDGGWLSSVTDALASVADAVVGGSPLEDIAHDLSEATGCKIFDIAYDFIRPDALLHAALELTTAATGSKIVQDVGEAKPWEAPKGTTTSMQGDGPSLKTRFEGAADATKSPEVMDAYAVTRDCTAAAMVTVGTCGTGTVAIVAIASSAALMAEQKADLLGKAGVGDKEAMWIRLGAQAALVVVTCGSAIAGFQNAAPGAARAGTAIVNGVNQVAHGAVQVGQAAYARETEEHMTNASKFESVQKCVGREQQRVLDGLRDLTKSYERTLETLAGAMNERDQAPLMLARHIA